MVKHAQPSGGIGHNYREFHTWSEVGFTQWSKWFAPVVAISEDGRKLLQVRAINSGKPVGKVPEFFSDLKEDNWGWLNGHAVCLDYGYTKLATMGLKKVRMKRWD